MTRCWCGRPAPHDSACGCCCSEHDDDSLTLALARVRALVTEHPDTQVPRYRSSPSTTSAAP